MSSRESHRYQEEGLQTLNSAEQWHHRSADTTRSIMYSAVRCRKATGPFQIKLGNRIFENKWIIEN